MAHAWNACWVNSPRGFKSPILRHRSPVLESKTGDFLYPLVLFLQNPTVPGAIGAPHTCRKHHHDLQKSRRQPPLPPARHDPCRLGRNPAAAGTPRHPHHHPKTLNLETLLAEDSTFYGDLFPHVVKWGGELYLEDGVHRALRNALHRRAVMYARVLDLDSISPALLPDA